MKQYTLSLVVISTFTMMACSQPAENKAASTPKAEQTQTATNPTAANKTSNTVSKSEASADNLSPNIAIASGQTKNTGFTYTAVGNEPDWAVDVKPDNTLVFSTPENFDGIRLKAERNVYAKGVEYTGTYKGKPFYLNLKGNQCNDTMADQVYDITAVFEFGVNTYKGCATKK